MMNKFFTADTHFGHRFVTEERGFSSTEEMDELIIENHNKVVGPNDEVFHLGDLSFRGPDDTLRILHRLNGRIHLVRGNHDSKRSHFKRRWDPVWGHFQSVDYYKEIKMDSLHIILCHYAFRVWNGHHYGSWNLHGHSHQNLTPSGRRQLDVGVDGHDYTPWHLDEVTEYMADKPIMVVDHHEPKERKVQPQVKPNYSEGNTDRSGWEKQEQGWFVHDLGMAVMAEHGGWYAYPKCKKHCRPKIGPLSSAEEAMIEAENY